MSSFHTLSNAANNVLQAAVPTSWLQDSVIAHLVAHVVDQVTPSAEGNPVSAVPGSVKDDGRLSIVWSWKPAGLSRLSDVRRGEFLFTRDEAVLSYAESVRPTKKRK